MKFLLYFTALISGAFLPVQAGLNSRMGKAIDNAVYASTISFLVGLVTLLIYLLITRQTVSWPALKAAPLYAWLGGILGAFYVTAIVLLFPRIGPALTFGLVVAGQMIVSLLLDHFNILVAQPHPINWWRILGVVMIVGGVVLIRKF